jgi:putative protease
LADRLSKTGGTPYRCEAVSAQLAPGLSLTAAAINALRRDALNQLTALRGRREVSMLLKMRKMPHELGSREHPDFTISVTTREQITPRLLKFNPAALYVPLHILAADPEFTRQLAQRVHLVAALPRIVHDDEMPAIRDALRLVSAQGVQEVLAGNLGLLKLAGVLGMQARGDFGLNIYNSLATRTLKELKNYAPLSATLSFEMTLTQVREVSKALPCELLVYGRMPLMVTENCLFKGKTGECACHMGSVKLVDKTGAEFPVIRDGNTCRSVLLNGKKLSLLDRQSELARLGLWALRLHFTTESAREVDHVLNSCVSSTPFDPGACTRGLYFRGLD